MDCTIILMGGGKGSRMGSLGKILPKVMLPIFDQTLITRQIGQLIEADMAQEIVISASIENHAILSELIDKYIDSHQENLNGVNIRVLENEGHQYGPLEALKIELDRIETSRAIMSLGDIFFKQNPFYRLSEAVNNHQHDYLAVAPPFQPIELTRGGIIHCEGELINRIIERPDPEMKFGVRWSGITIFDTHHGRDDLGKFLAMSDSGCPEGDLFQYRLEKGIPSYAFDCPDFINVNTPEQLLIAGIYRASEQNIDINESMLDINIQLRKELTNR